MKSFLEGLGRQFGKKVVGKLAEQTIKEDDKTSRSKLYSDKTAVEHLSSISESDQLSTDSKMSPAVHRLARNMSHNALLYQQGHFRPLQHSHSMFSWNKLANMGSQPANTVGSEASDQALGEILQRATSNPDFQASLQGSLRGLREVASSNDLKGKLNTNATRPMHPELTKIIHDPKAPSF